MDDNIDNSDISINVYNVCREDRDNAESHGGIVSYVRGHDIWETYFFAAHNIKGSMLDNASQNCIPKTGKTTTMNHLQQVYMDGIS